MMVKKWVVRGRGKEQSYYNVAAKERNATKFFFEERRSAINFWQILTFLEGSLNLTASKR
jgi:hypothetical protein